MPDFEKESRFSTTNFKTVSFMEVHGGENLGISLGRGLDFHKMRPYQLYTIYRGYNPSYLIISATHGDSIP